MRGRIWCLVLLLATLPACRREPTPPAPSVPDLHCPSFIPAISGLPGEGEWRTHPAIGDVNRDGLDDFAAMGRKTRGPRVFLSDGLGGWADASAGLEYEHGFSCGVGTRLVDLDGDGDLDLVAADHCEGLRVWRGDGGSKWTEDPRGIPHNLQGFNDAAVGELDGDGLLDLVAISAFGRGFLVLAGEPDGSWRVVPDTGLPATGSGWQVILADVNGDSALDVVCSYDPISTDRRQPPAPPAKVWLRGPEGRFRPARGFDGDGRYFGIALLPRAGRVTPDLLLASYGFHAGIYRYESESGEEWKSLGRIDESWFPDQHKGFSGLGVDDVDGDGCSDVLANEGSMSNALLALGDCKDRWRLCPLDTVPGPDLPTAGWGLATGDFNGDGRRDVVSGLGTRLGSLRAWLQVDVATAAAWRAQGQGPLASSTAQAAPEP